MKNSRTPEQPHVSMHSSWIKLFNTGHQNIIVQDRCLQWSKSIHKANQKHTLRKPRASTLTPCMTNLLYWKSRIARKQADIPPALFAHLDKNSFILTINTYQIHLLFTADSFSRSQHSRFSEGQEHISDWINRFPRQKYFRRYWC